MTMLLPLFVVQLLGCQPVANDCASGLREEVTATVDSPSGPVAVTTSQCVASAWTSTACDEGPGLCEYYFEPNTPAKAPLELIFGDFVFRHAVGHVELDPPAAFDGATDIQVALNAIQYEMQADRFRASTVQPLTLIDGNPAYKLTIACDHPDTDPICPFSWQYLFVDLDAVSPGLYADFTAQYANFVDAGNNAAAQPEEFIAYDEMIASVELTIE